MITLGKRGDLHAYRQALLLKRRDSSKETFDEIAPKYVETRWVYPCP